MANIKAYCILFMVLGLAGPLAAKSYRQVFDREAFYKTLKQGGVEDINSQLQVIEASGIKEKNAYSGVLLMKEAGLVKKPQEKLHLFKQGRIQFETAFNADTSNVEYHFLRLIIQEKAPKIVKYRAQLTQDSEFIKKHYATLPPYVQHVVADYSKTSSILHAEDF